jgi:transcription-repair coupling factor (superfamily II helicase)
LQIRKKNKQNSNLHLPLRKLRNPPKVLKTLDMTQTASHKDISYRRVLVSGLVGPARTWHIAAVAKERQRLVVVCPTRRDTETLIRDLELFYPASQIYHLPAWDTLPFEPVSPQLDVSATRIKTFVEIQARKKFVVVCSVDALVQRSLPLNHVLAACRKLEVGSRITREDLLTLFDICGFSHVGRVEELGQYTVRGGVVDLFPSTSEAPVRIEFLDDEIEEIRLFDIETQRSRTDGFLDVLHVLPLRERIHLSGRDREDALMRLKARAQELDVPPREVTRYSELLTHNIYFPESELLHSILLPALVPPLSLLPVEDIVFLDDFGITHRLDAVADLLVERHQRLAEAGHLLPRIEQLYLNSTEFEQLRQERREIVFDTLILDDEDSLAQKKAQFHSSLLTDLSIRIHAKAGSGKAFDTLRDQVNRWREDGYTVAFVVSSESRQERLLGMLLENKIEAYPYQRATFDWIYDAKRLPLTILQGQLSAGVIIEEARLILVAEQDIFGERSQRQKRKKVARVRRVLNALAQLSEGDYVVHVDYGIGVYKGLRHIEVEGTTTDFLHIDYADSTLYLPAHNIGKIHKFSAADDQVPVVDKLSSTKWKTTKKKVRSSIAALAGELIKLYAQRHVVKGWRYEPFGAQDEEFADSFPYNETPDQLNAILDTLNDMASENPMDRLVCGDVGFGKTEVAIRAAYKCLQHGRQVAVLVPTTILVEQHKRSFLERFTQYPFRIESLSRMHQGREAKRIAEDLENGTIDILIGTHKILGKNLRFRDLGLLIIDEEHRFGVKQKEHLKRTRTSVDVLTLTATPIPRTLHMSLLGIRDISVITTPPPDRRVVRSYVAERDPYLVRDAIMRELQRGGQCFYVHNKVKNIEAVTAELREIIPEARIIYAHGQMSERQVERLMRSFILHEADVLVSTTIIESGIDVPNANTMIINNAHAFGLAQLYQLRGRVGRSNRQAYTYFLIPRARNLTPEAGQRLKVLQSLDELGVGFNLSVRDMEIRGAGNLLGGEQSGNVLAVGFDLYTKILKDAILHLRGEEQDIFEAVDPEIKLSVSAFIPDSYVPDISERLLLYQRLASFLEPHEADDLMEEFEDRFGPMPPEVRDLIEIMRLKSLIRHFGVVCLERRPDRLLISLSTQAPLDIEKILLLGANFPQQYRFGRNLTLTRFLEDEEESIPELYQLVYDLLLKIKRNEEASEPEPLQGRASYTGSR